VICGVGHETDVTLCDFAADLRAPTPTAAAELCAPVRDGLLLTVAALAQALALGVERHVQSAAQRLDRLALHMRRPGDLALRERFRLQALARRLARASDTVLSRRVDALPRTAADLRHAMAMQRIRAAHRLQELATRLAACDPERTVARGYALVQTVDGALVTDPRQLHAGDTLRLSLAQGHADVELAGVHPR
jgi:exodeoxyribonuclease VII large subunit